MTIREDTEVIFHQGEPAERDNGYFVASDSDDTNKVRHHDDDKFWVVESYEAKTTRRMIELGAPELKSRVDGHIFQVDAKMLIEFIAISSGLIVEFKNRKRQELSPENAEKRRLRMAVLNAKMRGKIQAFTDV